MAQIVDIHGNAFVQNSHRSTVSGALRYDQLPGLLGISHNGKRSTYDVYGYPEDLGSTDGFRFMWEYGWRRQGVGNRVCAGVARTCWRDGFNIKQDAEPDSESVLVDDVAALTKAGLVKKMERADILNRIGRMSILFIGVPDGLDPSEPLGRATSGNIDDIYFKPFAFDGIEITQWDRDPLSPRNGLPVMYQAGKRSHGGTTKDVDLQTINIHYTRVVHLNENGLDSDIDGMGALEPVINNILDIEKACGGASEAYFRNARGKIAFEIDPDFSKSLIGNEAAKVAFDAAAEKFTHDWQDQIAAIGAQVKALVTPHASPLDTIKVSLWIVSGYTGIPLRVLTGEGAGQLAGSEDQLAYNQIIADRQRLFCAEVVTGALEIIQAAGIIKLPDDFVIEFPVQKAVTELQKADIGSKRADAMTKVSAARSSIGGMAIDLRSSLDAVGLQDVKIDELKDDETLIQDAELGDDQTV
ncbi:DUF1073 domain-containing protein [Candidatus Pacearchaeota archaeon]|nr:DUF1073 domain-containing protein [Candidatus Pacearchaeota archaeon]